MAGIQRGGSCRAHKAKLDMFSKLTTVFHASVLLLIMNFVGANNEKYVKIIIKKKKNFVIILPKYLGIHKAIAKWILILL